MNKIPGGYYIKARKIQESSIAKAPPHVREIWDYLLMKANHANTEKYKRGECFVSYKEIINDLSWFVGYRKMSYKKHHCEIAMKRLTKESMIATTKTTRGIKVSIINYDYYQDPKNYESYTTAPAKTTRMLQRLATINKNGKNGKKDNDIYSRIISYLNKKTEKNFSPKTKGTRSHINARLSDGFIEENFYTVIDNKVSKWLTDTKMREYLRPQTLFGGKFEAYLQDIPEEKDDGNEGVRRVDGSLFWSAMEARDREKNRRRSD